MQMPVVAKYHDKVELTFGASSRIHVGGGETSAVVLISPDCSERAM